MKKIKLIFFCFIFITILGSINVFAYDYEIENYDVNINVNENNTFDVVEKIKVNFLTPKHGIYRKIALMPELFRSNLTKYMNGVQLENISVNRNFSKSKEEGYQIITIGDKDKLLTGIHEYEIKYTYEVWRDSSKEIDEIYYPIIGNEWEDTIIKNSSFVITMPKAFEESSLKFLSGSGLNIYDANVDYKIEGNTIAGNLNTSLFPKESLSINISLPDGYFIKNKLEENKYPIYVMIFSVICVLIADEIWTKYGKDSKVEELIEYYPLVNYNSLEIAALKNKIPNNRNVMSLLLYLANKGYLKVEEIEYDNWYSKKKTDFEIIKIKDYEENNEHEKMFFDALFNNRDKIALTELSNDDDEFFKSVCEISNNINQDARVKNAFEKIPIGKMILLFIMAFMIFILSAVKPIITIRGVDLIIIFPLAYYLMAPIMFEIMGALYVIMFVVGTICLIVTILFISLMTKRTDYGNDILAKINGFERFIKNAKKEELESLIKKNPNYFYEILPYAYSLGISKICIEKFKDLDIEPPVWYYSLNEFDFNDFSQFIDLNIAAVVVAIGNWASGYSGGMRWPVVGMRWPVVHGNIEKKQK